MNKSPSIPILLFDSHNLETAVSKLSKIQSNWLTTNAFHAKDSQLLLLPDDSGKLCEVWLGIGEFMGKDNPFPKPNMASINKALGCDDLVFADVKHWLLAKLSSLFNRLPAGEYHLPQFDNEINKQVAIAYNKAAYKYNSFSNNLIKKQNPQHPRIHLLAEEDRYTETIRTADYLVRDLINTPANLLGPFELAMAAEQIANELSMNFDEVSGEDLSHGYPMIAAVGAASDRKPRLVEVSSKQPDSNKQNLCIVGKGVVFDTGGLDIKPSRNMLLMKKDMGGAAHALGLTYLVAKLSDKYNIKTIIPIVENSISGAAFRPSDVLTARDGTTVEIGNTDAEGRLVLADALCKANEYPYHKIITLATLTGAARVALGPDIPAMFTDNNAWAAEIMNLGLESGDNLWRLPLFAGLDSGIKSKVADINSVALSPFAGASVAAMFLRRFITKPSNWLHFDLYAWGKNAGSSEEAARMQAIHTLTNWLTGVK